MGILNADSGVWGVFRAFGGPVLLGLLPAATQRLEQRDHRLQAVKLRLRQDAVFSDIVIDAVEENPLESPAIASTVSA